MNYSEQAESSFKGCFSDFGELLSYSQLVKQVAAAIEAAEARGIAQERERAFAEAEKEYKAMKDELRAGAFYTGLVRGMRKAAEIADGRAAEDMDASYIMAANLISDEIRAEADKLEHDL
jgi:hypothetical protein